MSLDHLDKEDFDNLFIAVAVGEVDSACDHSTSTVTVDDGVYTFDCPLCGRHGFGDEASARYLGWIE